MAARMVNFWLLFFFIKSAIFDRGFVNDVHTNMKFQCAGSMKEVFTVKSELQCSHRCLYRSCSRLNYKIKREEKDNCEVFTKDGECTALSDQDGWKAIIFKVQALIVCVDTHSYDISMSTRHTQLNDQDQERSCLSLKTIFGHEGN